MSIPMPETSDNCDSDVATVVTYEDNAANFGSLFGEVSVEVETVAEHTERRPRWNEHLPHLRGAPAGR